MSFDQLHCQEVHSIDLFDRVDCDDVRISEGRKRASLLLEARQATRIVRDLGRKHFECHRAAELVIDRPIHLSHPALADLGIDFVDAEPRTESQSQVCRGL